MYKELLSHEGHTRRFTVVPGSNRTGWEIRHEEDDRVIASVVYHDWHRVERAKNAFAAEANALRSRGWV
jgi:hypothetical protein